MKVSYSRTVVAVMLLSVLAAACAPEPPAPVLPTFAGLVGCYRATAPGVDDVEMINTGYSLGKYNVHPVTGPDLCAGTSGGPSGSYYYVIVATEPDAVDKCGAQFVNPAVTAFETNFGPALRYAWACYSLGT